MTKSCASGERWRDRCHRARNRAAALGFDSGVIGTQHTKHEQLTPLTPLSGKFVAQAILRRLDRHDGQRVVWSLVEVGNGVLVAELAVWGTEIGLWDWDVVNDRFMWINDWREHSQVTVFSGAGHEQLWSARIHPEDLPAYRSALTTHLAGQTPSYNVE